MKITIDTQADSKREISLAVQLLKSFVSGRREDVLDQSQAPATPPEGEQGMPGMMAMFDTPAPESPRAEPGQEKEEAEEASPGGEIRIIEY